jgi:transcriptional regulator with XRE-family HTH domain
MRQGKNQKILAEEAHMPQGNLSRIEKGKYGSIHPARLIALAQALHVTTDYLLGLESEQPIAQAGVISQAE